MPSFLCWWCHTAVLLITDRRLSFSVFSDEFFQRRKLSDFAFCLVIQHYSLRHANNVDDSRFIKRDKDFWVELIKSVIGNYSPNHPLNAGQKKKKQRKKRFLEKRRSRVINKNSSRLLPACWAIAWACLLQPGRQ